jgi:2-keto-4-pentenoate hydratase/2-oxohepta-3-ene-1,7-dioic acid hydratase in catechol pathway
MYCIGRNYAAHAAEMGASVPTDPIVFLKPPAAYCPSGSVITLPSFSNDVHHEVELVVFIGADADEVAEEDAWNIVAGVGVGIDFTARDVQARAKKNGEPWATAKAWRHSAPISELVPLDRAGTGPWDLTLSVNGVVKQHGSTAMMERSVPRLISYLASVFSLRAGDVIFTGTPEGVGPVHSGDIVTASLSNLAHLTVTLQ